MKKVGRNDLCPCGSGKKYKKCCGSTGNLGVVGKRAIDYFEINRDIAYRGKIGQQRKKYCIQFIVNNKRSMKEMEKERAKFLLESKKEITCQKGCYYCCSAYVESTLQECEAIVYYLYEHDEIRKEFLKKYPQWREKVQNGGDLHKQCGRFWDIEITSENAGKLQEECRFENQKYYDQGISCPFLNNDSCSIYEVRPNMCFALTSVSPKDYCKPRSETKPETIKTAKLDFLTDCSFYYNKLERPAVTFMPIAVYEIMKNGTFYFSQGGVPGLEKLDEEFCRDPEVFSVLKKYGVLNE